jgi:hypothetical protein
MAAVSTEIPIVHDSSTVFNDIKAKHVAGPNAEMLCKAMNIDMNAPCELQRPDMNFFEVRCLA